MKLKILKSKWGLYFLLFYLFVAVASFDLYTYGSRELLRAIPYYIEDLLVISLVSFGWIIDLILPGLKNMFRNPLVASIVMLAINLTCYYYVGFALEKLYKRFRP